MPLTDPDTVLTMMGVTRAGAPAAVVLLADFLTPVACTLVKEYVRTEIELATFTEYLPDARFQPVDDQLVDGYEVIGGRAVPRGPRGQHAGNVLALRQTPVRDVVSVHWNPAAWDTDPPAFPADTELVEGPAFRVDYGSYGDPGVDPAYPKLCKTGLLVRTAGVWGPVGRSVRVVYKGGYTPAELSPAGRWGRFGLAAATAAATWVKSSRAALSSAGGTSGILTAETIGAWSRTWAAPAVMTAIGLDYALPGNVLRLLESDRSYANVV